jgi:3-methyladenine DNA glycosylase AlkC
MKTTMMRWIKSDNERKRALAFHGMEAVSYDDPGYIMDFVSYAIDDDSVDVQKKITHILTQVARVNPIIVFPYIREWLIEGKDSRTKTIWVSMKKLTNIVVQKYRRDRSNDFAMLTQQTVQDWMNDENEYVSNMGERLGKILNMTEEEPQGGRRQQGNYR